jgi:ribonuclease HI
LTHQPKIIVIFVKTKYIMPERKYYVVWNGKNTGVYDTWKECERQIRNFPGALYKAFTDREEAVRAFRSDFRKYIGKNTTRPEISKEELAMAGTPEWASWSVDAACSGNPGVMEYRGVETSTGRQLFHQGPFEEGTVNIGEFLAIVHALALLKKQGSNLPVYSDSRTAIKWVKQKSANTKLAPGKKNEKLFDMLERAENWLQENEFPNRILKWETKYWGEIPADFGRK